jgi:large subunit ribosomal protein L15
MSLSLGTIKRPKSNRSKRRVGRGAGTGRGTYSGRGMKGQRARSGGKKGLQKRAIKSVILRLPKHSHQQGVQPKAQVVTLQQLGRTFKAGATITPNTLVKKELVEAGTRVKVLATGTLQHALNFKNCAVSQSAVEKIKAAGGSVE